MLHFIHWMEKRHFTDWDEFIIIISINNVPFKFDALTEKFESTLLRSYVPLQLFGGKTFPFTDGDEQDTPQDPFSVYNKSDKSTEAGKAFNE